MEEFWILILLSFFATNSLEKAESVKVKLEETPLKTFDEIFGEGWWDKGEAEDLKTPAPTNFGQNVHHQIDRQNTQIGQIEPNSTDQLGQIEPNSTDQFGQIEPNSTDQFGQIEPNSTDQFGQIEPNSTDKNLPLTESDHSDNAEDERKRKIIDKFHAIKEEYKQKGKYSKKEWIQIEKKISKHLKVSRTKIFEWKKEFGLSQKVLYNEEERKHLVEKFDQMKAELTWAGFKNSYKQEIDKTVAKKLGLSFKTIYAWKREFGQTKPNHKYVHSEQLQLMKRYYEIKDTNPKIRDEDIAKMFKIRRETLYKWKKQFLPNSVDGNAQEIENRNSGSI